MADYAIKRDGGVVYIPTRATIPADEGNADWRAYQAWLAAGGVPDELETDAQWLQRARRETRERIRQEAARRCGLAIEALDKPNMVDLLAEIWPHLAASKNNSAPLVYCKNVVLAGRTLVADLANEPDPAFLEAFNVAAWSGWPALP
jgi:hypothetical protein